MARNDGYSYSCFSKFIRKVLIEHLNVKSEVKNVYRDYGSSCIIQTLANRNYTSNTPKLVSKTHKKNYPAANLFSLSIVHIYQTKGCILFLYIHYMCYIYMNLHFTNPTSLNRATPVRPAGCEVGYRSFGNSRLQTNLRIALWKSTGESGGVWFGGKRRGGKGRKEGVWCLDGGCLSCVFCVFFFFRLSWLHWGVWRWKSGVVDGWKVKMR